MLGLCRQWLLFLALELLHPLTKHCNCSMFDAHRMADKHLCTGHGKGISTKSPLKPFLAMIVFCCTDCGVGRGLRDWQQAQKASTKYRKSLFAEAGQLNPHTALYATLLLQTESWMTQMIELCSFPLGPPLNLGAGEYRIKNSSITGEHMDHVTTLYLLASCFLINQVSVKYFLEECSLDLYR